MLVTELRVNEVPRAVRVSVQAPRAVVVRAVIEPREELSQARKVPSQRQRPQGGFHFHRWERQNEPIEAEFEWSSRYETCRE